MCEVYVCPECGGNWESKQYKRIKRWDGDHLETWPSYCGLCNEGVVTLDEIVARSNDPLMHIERLLAPPAVMTAQETADATNIPF